MRKSTIIVKRLLALFLVVLMSIESFGAVVSDNDGSAFITKAEFDSLKNNFQRQIEQYNTSIDSKIDGAIASYLAGIDVKVTSMEKCISYFDDEGVLSVRGRDDIKWKEGMMIATIKYNSIRNKDGFSDTPTTYTANGGLMDLTLTSSDRGDSGLFNELLVDEVNYSTKFARWVGKAVTKQYIYANTIEHRTGSESFFNWGRFSDGVTICHASNSAGTYSRSNIQILPGGSNSGTLLTEHIYAPNGTTGGNGFTINANNTLLTRVTQSITNEHIIVTNTSVAEQRFSNNDEIRDWCNDTEIDGHDGVETDAVYPLQRWLDGGTANIFVASSDVSKWVLYTTTNCGGNSINSKNKPSNHLKIAYPYFGFVGINDWNKIATNDYDGYINDMLLYHPDLELITTKNTLGINKKHLSLTAGLPLLFAKNESEVTIPIEFKDNNDHEFWVKVGSFSKNTAAQDDINCLTATNMKNVTYNSSTKSFVINSGVKGEITISMPKDGYLFCKWSILGNGHSGGGIYLPKESLAVKS